MMQSQTPPKPQDENTTSSKTTQQTSTEKVILHALSMAFGTLSSRVLGLVRDILFAAYFSRTVTDAWTAAFRLPNLFRRLLGEGSLSVSFIPVYVQAREQDPSLQHSQRLNSAFFTLLFCVLSFLTVCGIIFSEELLGVILEPAYRDIPGKFLLTVQMAKIMFGFIFLMSTYAYFMALLNSVGEFTLPAMAPTLFNVAMIISTLLPGQVFAFNGEFLAWGVIAGGVLQTGILIPALLKKNLLPQISWHWRDPGVFKILRNMVPGLLGTGLAQITTLVNLKYASRLGEGPISYIFWADRLLELPLSLVSVSLGTALLPTLSALWAQNKKREMMETSVDQLSLNLFISIPAGFGLYFLAMPLVQLIFQRGAFSIHDAEMTAMVLQIYAFILISSSLVRVLVPVFYAIQNTWFPAVASGFCLLVHILVAPIMMERYRLQGLVFSTFLSSSLNFILIVGGSSLLIGAFPFRKLSTKFLIFSSLSMTIAGWSWFYFWWVERFPATVTSRWVEMLVFVSVIIAAAISYFALSAQFRVKEFTWVNELIFKKILRRLGLLGAR